MTKSYFTIPYVTELRREDGWSRSAESDRTYFVVRCHYMLEDLQLPEPIRLGRVVGAYTSVPGVAQKITKTITFEETTLNVQSILEESLLENESIREFVSSIAGGLEVKGVAKLSSELRDRSSERLHESLRDTLQLQVSETSRRNLTYSWEYTIDPDKFPSNSTVVLSPAYKRHAYDLRLVMADYLFITYKRPHIGAKLRRIKWPEVIGSTAVNVIRFNLPLASIRYWSILSDTIFLRPENEHKVEVQDALDVEVESPVESRPKFTEVPSRRPSLYELSNQAFPLKRWT